MAALQRLALRGTPKATKAAARYTPAGGAERCGMCRHYVPSSSCARIEGPVSAAGWCQLYSQQVTWRPRAGQDAGLNTGSYPPGSTLDLSFMTPGSLDGRITFTRASTATYFDAAGVLQTAAANAPRWDYDPITHALNGLLLEQAGTNLLLNSATLSTQSVTVTAVASALSFYGTGTITLSGAATVGPLTGTGPYPQRVWMGFTPAAGTLTLTVIGNVQNAQLEQVAILTSYIPTAGASATRAVDSATMLTSPWYTSGTTLALSMVADALVPVGAGNFLQFDDTTNNNRTLLACTSGPFQGTSSATEIAAGVTNYNNNSLGKIPFGTPFKLGYSTVSGAHFYALNGATSVLNTTVGNLPAVTTLKLGRAVPATLGSFYLRRARYWPRALSVSELQEVTA